MMVEVAIILIALAFEAGVLLRVFQRPPSQVPASLFFAPAIALFAVRAAPTLASALPQIFTTARVDYAAVFALGVLCEIPLSLYGQPLSPPASFLERCVVAASIAVASALTAKAFYV